MRLWAVALVRSGSFPNVVWKLVGIFSTREKAEAACKDRMYFVMPVELHEDHGTEPTYSGEDYFPKSPVN
jgi:hypothetical protein